MTATPNAEATADREPLPMAELSEIQAFPPDHPVQVTIHVDVARIFEDCKTINAFNQAMDGIVSSVLAMTQALPE